MNTLNRTPTTVSRDDCTLVGATHGYGDYALRTYDSCSGDLYVYGHEYGPSIVIRADSWESAYEIAIDESNPIDFVDEHEAYGFDTLADFQARDTDNDDALELAEGYRYQANASGTGIVNVGHYEWLAPLTVFNDARKDDPARTIKLLWTVD